MTGSRIEIDTTDRGTVRAAVQAALDDRDLSEVELDFLLHYASARAGDNDQVLLPRAMGECKVLGAARLSKRYVLKVGVGVMGAAALALDALLTRGIAIGALTLAGVDLRALVRLSEDTGEVCTFAAVIRLRDLTGLPLDASALAHQLSGVPCGRNGDPCAIHTDPSNPGPILASLDRMADLGLLSVSNGTVKGIAF